MYVVKKIEMPITLSLEKILWILFRRIVKPALPTELTYQRQIKMSIRPPFDQV